MIKIDRTCKFIKLIINKNIKGLFLPQNDEYVCISEMVKAIED